MSLELVRVIIGVSAAALGVFTYVAYFRSIAKGLTKPHAVSWGLWAVLDVIAFFGQLDSHAGPAVWLTGSTALLCALTCLIGVVQRQVKIDFSDWLILAGASVAVVLILILPSPLLAVIVGQVTTSIGYIPTVKKVIRQPASEDLLTYVTAVVKFAMQVAALTAFNYVALSGPIIAVVTSGLMTVLIWRLQHSSRVEKAGVPVSISV